MNAEKKARERARELTVEITGLTVLHIDRAPKYCSDACGGDLGRENCMAVGVVEILTVALLDFRKEGRKEMRKEAESCANNEPEPVGPIPQVSLMAHLANPELSIRAAIMVTKEAIAQAIQELKE